MAKPKFTTEQVLRELRRELALRQKLYPKWVADGSLARDTAQYQTEIMQFLVEEYEAKQAQQHGTQSDLLSE